MADWVRFRFWDFRLDDVRAVERHGEWIDMAFAVPPPLAEGLVPKGSVAVDGVSLTVVDANPGGFSVALIPHTLAETTLGRRAVGDAVNARAAVALPAHADRPVPEHARRSGTVDARVPGLGNARNRRPAGQADHSRRDGTFRRHGDAAATEHPRARRERAARHVRAGNGSRLVLGGDHVQRRLGPLPVHPDPARLRERVGRQ